MKKCLWVLLMVSSTAFAGAGPLQCVDLGNNDSEQYSVYISANRKRAVVQEVVRRRTTALATLRCTPAENGGGLHPHQPDATYPLFNCSEPNVRDAGYSIRVRGGGLAGRTVAILSKVSIAGLRPLARLTCAEAE